MARGLVNCIRAWHVRQPDVLVMRGAPTDNNATLFARGYDHVLRPYFASGRYTDAGQPPGSWDPTAAQTTFEEQYTANNKITAVLTPNDDTASAVISYLKTLNTPPAPSRPPARTRPRPGWPTSWPATSAAPSTSRSTWRRRPPRPSPCTCGPGGSRRPAWSTAPPSIRPARSGCPRCCCDRSG